jgi:putative serine protease PepD
MAGKECIEVVVRLNVQGEGRSMALVACRECGARVSSEAPSCPHCGILAPGGATASAPRHPHPTANAPQRPRSARRKGGTGYIVFSILLAAVALFCFYIANTDTESGAPTTKAMALIAPPAAKVKLTPAEIAARIKPSTVYIATTFTETDTLIDDEFAASGTGVIVSKEPNGDYWILTNAHVLGFYAMQQSDLDGQPELAAHAVEVRFHDGTTAPVTELLDHEAYDFSMIRVPGATGDYPVAACATDLPAVGDPVYAMGHPMGLEYTFTTGMVSAIRDVNSGGPAPFHVIQTDTAINPGNSGGPLLDQYGLCTGINTEIIAGQQQGLNFAYSTADILRDHAAGRFVEQGLDLDGIRRWIGVGG